MLFRSYNTPYILVISKFLTYAPEFAKRTATSEEKPKIFEQWAKELGSDSYAVNIKSPAEKRAEQKRVFEEERRRKEAEEKAEYERNRKMKRKENIKDERQKTTNIKKEEAVINNADAKGTEDASSYQKILSPEELDKQREREEDLQRFRNRERERDKRQLEREREARLAAFVRDSRGKPQQPRQHIPVRDRGVLVVSDSTRGGDHETTTLSSIDRMMVEESRVAIQKLIDQNLITAKEMNAALRPFMLNSARQTKETQIPQLDLAGEAFQQLIGLFPKVTDGTLYDYTTLISTLGKLKQLDVALHIYETQLKPKPSDKVSPLFSLISFISITIIYIFYFLFSIFYYFLFMFCKVS